jgi:hypothetical protein
MIGFLLDAYVGNAPLARRDAKRTRPQCGPGVVAAGPSRADLSLAGATRP